MNVMGLGYKPVSFGKKESEILRPNDLRDVKKLEFIYERLTKIIQEIEGIGPVGTSSFEEKIVKAKEKVERLRHTTREAWSTCPSALKQKLGKLDKIDDELTALDHAYKQVSEDIDNSKPGLIVPGQKDGKSKGGLITDPSEILGGYNRLPKDTSEALRVLKGQLKTKPSSTSSLQEIKNTFEQLNKKNWDFEKFNAQDSKIFSKLKGTLLIGELGKVVKEQIAALDKKIAELKEKEGKDLPKLGLKVYTPEVTGKIMALETAKLRRDALSDTVLIPGLHDNLDKPDVLIQQIPNGLPIAFKIDKSFIPKKQEIKEILKLNEPYAPVLKKLFNKNLPVYMVPGYMDSKGGEIEGGMSLPGHPEEGVWLNSYNTEERYFYTSMMEQQTATLRGLKRVVPSVVKGNKDRARALAHEIGHAIAYKMINNDSNNKDESGGSSLIISPGTDIDFMSGWKGVRTGAELNGHETHRTETRGLSDSSLANLHLVVDYEMVAEDIRVALTGEKVPASSKMTGIHDQTEAGSKQLAAVKDYLKEVLLDNVKPADAFLKHMIKAG